MGVFKKLTFIMALVISVVSGITLSSGSVEARWVFDASPPTTVITQPIGDSVTTLTAKITDNKTLSIATNKHFYFLINDSALPSIPGTTTSTSLYPNNCPSRITPDYTPCLISIQNQPEIIAGAGGGIIAERKKVEFSANNPTYYIYGKLLQDEVGNSGEWSTAKTFSPKASKEDPFLQTTEGDVHSNKNIDTRKKP